MSPEASRTAVRRLICRTALRESDSPLRLRINVRGPQQQEKWIGERGVMRKARARPCRSPRRPAGSRRPRRSRRPGGSDRTASTCSITGAPGARRGAGTPDRLGGRWSGCRKPGGPWVARTPPLSPVATAVTMVRVRSAAAIDAIGTRIGTHTHRGL